MLNLKPDIVAALENTQAQSRVFFFYPPSDQQLPFVVYHEIQNDPKFFADNAEQTSKIGYAISAFCDGSTSDLTAEINSVMVELGFIRDMCIDGAPENGAQVKHMRFIIEREVL